MGKNDQMAVRMNGKSIIDGSQKVGGHLQEETETWVKGGTKNQSIGGILNCDT